MKSVLITIPYPPSVNKTYFNRTITRDQNTPNKLSGRGLTKEAKAYKVNLSFLLHFQFHNLKFGDHPVKVTIQDNPLNDRRDNHNCEKIVFDAIQLSGLIDNDKQIIAHEMIPGTFKNPPTWTIKIEPYLKPREDVLS